jgi:hypothetical protein
MPSPQKFPVQLTLAEIVALSDLIKSVHADQAYYAKDRLDEVGDSTWKTESILSARKKQAAMSKLHFALLGEELELTPEKDPTPVEVDA